MVSLLWKMIHTNHKLLNSTKVSLKTFNQYSATTVDLKKCIHTPDILSPCSLQKGRQVESAEMLVPYGRKKNKSPGLVFCHFSINRETFSWSTLDMRNFENWLMLCATHLFHLFIKFFLLAMLCLCNEWLTLLLHAPVKQWPTWRSIISYNNFHNVSRLFNVLPNFQFTTTETKRDY